MQDVTGFHRHFDFGTGCDQDRLAFAFGVSQDVGALFGQVLEFVLCAQGRQTLAGEGHDGWGCFGCDCDFPCFGCFHGIRRAEYVGVWRGTGDRNMLNRLVGWAIFANTDGIVCHDKDCWNFHQGRKAHGWAGIVCEGHECAAVCAHTAV